MGRVRDGYLLSFEEAVEIVKDSSLNSLCQLANDLRVKSHGDTFDMCSILNARSGRCSEDCKWCSQSKFHKTNVDIYPLLGAMEAVEAAKYNEGKGVRRFSLVTSGRAMSDDEIDKCCGMYSEIKKSSNIKLCASMGLLNREQLMKLQSSGVGRYHCNLETAPSHFESLCTTHTIEDKLKTIHAAQELGMAVCSGGIIGMGESMEQRIELAIVLRDNNILSIPINILNPIKGTLLEGTPPLDDDEILRTIAIFKILNPEAHIRLAGGRAEFNHLMKQLLESGVSASIVGDMLTTVGCDIDSDRAMFEDMGLKI